MHFNGLHYICFHFVVVVVVVVVVVSASVKLESRVSLSRVLCNMTPYGLEKKDKERPPSEGIRQMEIMPYY